jgi:hypothetical protein
LKLAFELKVVVDLKQDELGRFENEMTFIGGTLRLTFISDKFFNANFVPPRISSMLTLFQR